jgi:hypothetical protein
MHREKNGDLEWGYTNRRVRTDATHPQGAGSYLSPKSSCDGTKLGPCPKSSKRRARFAAMGHPHFDPSHDCICLVSHSDRKEVPWPEAQ